MRRGLLVLAAGAAALAGAEVARRDLQVAVACADPAFSYRLRSPAGTFSGDDAFTRDVVLRPGARWALARPGSAWAPLVGADLTLEDAPIASGGLRAYGLAVSAGATWAASERWSLDAEGWAGWARATLDLATPDGGNLAGSGDEQGVGARIRVLCTPSRRWSLGIEAGWAKRTATIGADLGRDIDLDLSGWSAGLVVAWRPSARPAGLE